MTAGTVEAAHGLRISRRATSSFFLVCGLVVGAWGAMVPFAQAKLGLNHADLGLIMVSGGFGAVVAMPVGGILAITIGSRSMIGLAVVALAGLLPGVMLAPTGLSLGVVLFGITGAMGVLDIAMNDQAVAYEGASGRPSMSSFHGFFSVGGLVAPVSVGLALGVGLAPLAFLLTISAALLIILLLGFPHLYHRRRDRSGAGFVLPRGRVWVFGLICLVFYMAEGSVFDWSALFLRDHRAVVPAWSGLGLATFSVAMTVARLTGDRLVRRFGPVAVMGGGAGLAAIGMFVVITIPFAGAGLAGFALFGMGAGNVVPLVMSAAGRLPGLSPAVGIAASATLGNCGIVAGPAGIGFLADAVGLPLALGVVAFMVSVVAVSARVVRTEG